MARKLIRKPTRVGRCSVLIFRDSDYEEYFVETLVPHGGRGKMRVEGRKGGGAFDTDLVSARATAAREARRLRKKPACRAQ